MSAPHSDLFSVNCKLVSVNDSSEDFANNPYAFGIKVGQLWRNLGSACGKAYVISITRITTLIFRGQPLKFRIHSPANQIRNYGRCRRTLGEFRLMTANL